MKTNKRGWSNRTFIPFLADEFKSLCAAQQLLTLIDMVKPLDVEPVKVKDFEGKDVWAKPLLVCKKANATRYTALAEDTVSNYFKKVFLDNVEDSSSPGTGAKLSKRFSSHSCRNAVASLLSACAVTDEDIAAHAATTAASLRQTYIRPIDDPYESLPHQCLQVQPFLAAKLLLPWLHTKFEPDGSGRCACSRLLSSKSSMEERASVAKA